MEKIERATITDYGYDGEGVCRVNGKVVFVPYTLKNETVRVQLKDEKSSFCNGKLVEVESASPLREEPPCHYYGKCGGCTYQHTDYATELQIKKELLEKQLSKVGFNGQIDVVKSGMEYGYRNKIKLFVSEMGCLYLKRRKSNGQCHVEECLLVGDKINHAIGTINTFLENSGHKKDYSEVVIRQEEDIVLINFYRTTRQEINYQGLYLMLGSNYGIFETFKGKTSHRIGQKVLKCEEFGLKCEFSPLSFHQVNDYVGKRLYQTVIENLTGKNVLNCYSGAGVLSGVIAKQGKRVVGVELGEAEHDDAERLKDINNLFYLTNINGDCGEVLDRLEEHFQTVVIDPPRGGIAEKVVQAINRLDFERLIYISCNSATLVRDLGRLQGLKIKEVKLFDMFARTGEYETLVILDKR